ncbi:hypothetical protein, partial [Nonomuraea sp. NPDC059022]
VTAPRRPQTPLRNQATTTSGDMPMPHSKRRAARVLAFLLAGFVLVARELRIFLSVNVLIFVAVLAWRVIVGPIPLPALVVITACYLLTLGGLLVPLVQRARDQFRRLASRP